MSSGEYDFGTGSVGDNAVPAQASSLRKGGYVVMKDRPAKVMDLSTSKTGKHGHAKINITAIDLFNGKKYEAICQSTHNVMVPNVTRKEMNLVDITDDNFCVLMDDAGEMKEDLQLPEGEEGAKIKEEFNGGAELVCTVVGAMGIEAILQHRTAGTA